MNIKKQIIEELRRLGARTPEQLFKLLENDFYIDDEGEVLIDLDLVIGNFEEVIERMKRDPEHWGNQFNLPPTESSACEWYPYPNIYQPSKRSERVGQSKPRF